MQESAARRVAMDDGGYRAEEGRAVTPAHKKALFACALCVLWACLGLILALHWVAIAFVLYRRGSSRVAVRSAAAHALSYWAASVAVAAGGTWCRSAGRYQACAGGEEMSWSCLMHAQPADYQVS